MKYYRIRTPNKPIFAKTVGLHEEKNKIPSF